MSAYQRCIREIVNRSAKCKPFKSTVTLLKPKLVYQELGRPAQHYKCIHVCGTNGKGSLCHKLANALQLCGHRVGLFTSPHVSTLRERIQINSEYISEGDLVAHCRTVFAAENRCIDAQIISDRLSFFEVLTLVGFLHFQQESVDFAIIECGLGGSFDSTNVIGDDNEVVLTAMTSVGLDHCNILGDTIEEIATDKAGIIRKSVPFVIGSDVPRSLVESIALEKGAPLFHGFEVSDDVDVKEEGSMDEDDSGCDGDGAGSSDYNGYNTALAKKCLECLVEFEHIKGDYLKKLKDQQSDVDRALLESRPLCRLEEMIDEDSGVRCIMDAAHNPHGMRSLFRNLHRIYPIDQFQYRCVFGACDRDNFHHMLRPMIMNCSDIHIVQATIKRAVPIDELNHRFCEEISVQKGKHDGLIPPTIHTDEYIAYLKSEEDGSSPPPITNDMIENTVQRAIALAQKANDSSEPSSVDYMSDESLTKPTKKKQIVVCLGSIYMMGAVRKALKVPDADIDDFGDFHVSDVEMSKLIGSDDPTIISIKPV